MRTPSTLTVLTALTTARGATGTAGRLTGCPADIG